jgi:hypothetical protein
MQPSSAALTPTQDDVEGLAVRGAQVTTMSEIAARGRAR